MSAPRRRTSSRSKGLPDDPGPDRQLCWTALDENEKSRLKTHKVKFQGMEVSLQEAFDHHLRLNGKENECLKHLKGKLLTDLRANSSPEILPHNLTEMHKNYVQRKFVTRKRISRHILSITKSNSGCNDILVFAGLQWYQLTTLMLRFGEGRTDRSNSQLQDDCTPVRCILLEKPDHFQKICERTDNPVHWLECVGVARKFRWVKSRGSFAKIQAFIEDSQVPQPEAEFCTQSYSSDCHKIICASAGMGKTTVISKIGLDLWQNRNKSKIVRLVRIKEIISALQKLKSSGATKNNLENIRKAFIEAFVHESEFEKELLHSVIEAQQIKFEVLIDGFDELDQKDIDKGMKIISGFVEEPVIPILRLWVTTPPHLLHELENRMGILGSKISDYDESDQITLLVGYWEQKYGYRDTFLKEKATSFIRKIQAVKHKLDDAITSSPMLCCLIADILKNEENDVFPQVNEEFGKNISGLMLTSIYTRYLQTRLDLGDIKEFATTDPIKLQPVYAHITVAILRLLPDLYEEIKTVFDGFDATTLASLPKYKIAESQRRGDLPHFTHRSFAEYFVALFFIYLTSEFDKLISSSCEKEKTRSNNILEALLSLCRHALVTDPIQSAVSIDKIKLDTFKFRYAHISYFLNFLLPETLDHTITSELASRCEDPESREKICTFLWQSLHGAILENLPHVIQIIRKCFDVLCQHQSGKEECLKIIDKATLTNAVFLAIKYGELKLVEPVIKLYESLTSESITTAEIVVTNRTGEGNKVKVTSISVLHAAVTAGHYQVVEYLLSEKGYADLLSHPENESLLYHCVTATNHTEERIIMCKMQILPLLISLHPALLDQLDQKEKPLLVERMHIDLLLTLLKIRFELKNELFQTREVCRGKSQKTILHLIPKNYYTDKLTTTRYYTILQNLAKYAKLDFNAPDNSNKLTPVHRLLCHLDLDEITVKYLLEQGANLNAVDNKGNTPIFKAIASQRSSATLKLLIKYGACYKRHNSRGVTPLHIAAGSLNYNALVLLVRQYGLSDLNIPDNSGSTPLHYAFSKQIVESDESTDPNNHHKVISFLLQGGANITAVDSDGLTPIALDFDNLCLGLNERDRELCAANLTRLLDKSMITLVLEGILFNKKFGHEWDPDFIPLLCKMLVEQGANLDHRLDDGLTIREKAQATNAQIFSKLENLLIEGGVSHGQGGVHLQELGEMEENGELDLDDYEA